VETMLAEKLNSSDVRVPVDSLEFTGIALPDLAEVFAREAHVSLLFDGRKEGRCLLAVGAKRSLTWGVERPECIEAWNQFLKNSSGEKTWAFGWLGYDLKNVVEKLHSERSDSAGFPVMHWVEPRVVIEWGGNRSKAEVVCGQNEPDANSLLLAVQRDAPETNPPAERIALKPRWDRSMYLQRVHRVKKHIQRGDVYELNLCQEWHGDGVLQDPWSAYIRLQRLTKAPYSALIKAGEYQLLCGSPELFLKKRGDQITSSPIKGTARRGADQEEDSRLARQLFNDPKERAENVMICDLVRNDLSKVALPGSVSVPELFGIHRFQTVHQMISTVQCTMAPEKSLRDLIEATFPMGSMTGAPKIRAMQLIEELEGTRRGIYSGTVGYVRPNGDLDLNVVIRSIACNERTQRISLQVGGAITAMSDPEKEYDECLLKAEALLQTLKGNA
jgi:para-aminobenzoate synthetase component 1